MVRYILFIALVFCGLAGAFSQERRALAKAEILAVEAGFQQMVKDSGVAAAFIHYAAPDAVIHRNDLLVVGRDAIIKYMANSKMDSIVFTWKADFIDASDDGTLGYSYGKYTFTAVDREGDAVSSSGVFHTIWRRQPSGEWRFVWD